MVKLKLPRQKGTFYLTRFILLRLLGVETVAIGSLNATMVHPREVFKAAILLNAAALVLVHNHPSGDPHPSEEDIEITRNLMKCGELLGIEAARDRGAGSCCDRGRLLQPGRGAAGVGNGSKELRDHLRSEGILMEKLTTRNP